MTPLSRLVSRLVPPVLRVPALGLVYAAMVAAVLLASRTDYAQIIYVDVRAQ
jgi:hypothetical protein